MDTITVDACENGCGGIWFDQFELQKVDEPHESAGEKLLEISKNPDVKVDHEKRINCPKCKDVVMMRHLHSFTNQVEVDECPNCAGFWLDFGELAQIREKYDSEEDRKKAAQAYFQEVFGEELKRMKSESDEKVKKARKIAHIFRFICPSYYMPGKQDWGAF